VQPWTPCDNLFQFTYLEDGTQVWLAAQSVDPRKTGAVMVHATGVVINSYHCEGRHLPGHAAHVLNAADIFSTDIRDDFPYLVIALQLKNRALFSS
jgi:hypothetical protein